MRLKGWLLDVRVDDDKVLLWVKIGEKRLDFKFHYSPDLYFLPNTLSYDEFTDLFHEHPNISHIEKVQRHLTLESSQESPVIRVIINSADHYHQICKLLGKFGEVFDSDISHTQRFLADFSLVPFGEIELKVDEQVVESIIPVPNTLSVEPPPFKIICFDVYHNKNLTILTYNDKLQEENNFSGETEETLSLFHEYIMTIDPDIICSMEADMKNLLKLSLKHKKPSLGIYHKKSFHLQDGRVFINLRTYRRTSLSGIVERIMYTREVPRIGSDWAAGRAIESRQCYEARRRGFLLPKRGFYQPVMSLKELLKERDHGGLILAPSIGLHENVAALDFESMFPHLILKENISYENVRSNRNSEGFLLDFTRDALERRLYYKHLKKELAGNSDMWFWCETRQQALKEILFCTYGYSGCWANKFGNMDTFHEINKASRETLVQAMSVARSHGYKILYGNSDSLFLQKENATKKDFDDLASTIHKKVSLPITVENHFRYLVLLPQKSDDSFGAINRYYGLRYDGEIVCRGIELRRRNTSRYIADIQMQAINLLLTRESKEKVVTEGIEAVNNLIKRASRELCNKQVPADLLEANTILRRKTSKYKSRLPHVAAAEALNINGINVEKGTVIKYIYVDAEHSNPFRRISPSGFQQSYDPDKYIQLLQEAKKSILLPFDEEKITRSNSSLDQFLTPQIS